MTILHPHEGKDYFKAHQYSSDHRKQIEQSTICGCFYCLAKFKPSAIEEWIDENDDEVGQTALCPRCDIDSVIGSESGFEITDDLLKKMNKYWF
ncbi:cytoplasmic protein [Pontiella sp. NLcol2]|uniref:Cytoplasmic protein n=1 Tax=Pontiella agarivorans TaxID=3038953 RepID=A0ABU5MZ90_9BACT|nr:cytoplasmic protein [Pontiella agarivorans]